jgi:hypothetical protein
MSPRSGNVIEVRAHDVRLLSNGRVIATLPRASRTLTIPELVRIVRRPRWISLRGDTATLTAGLYQGPRTSLIVGGGTLENLRLADVTGTGGTIRGSDATVRFDDIVVTGWNVAGRQPALPSLHRPFITYIDGSRVSIARSTFDHLGRARSGGRGVTVGSHSSLTVSDSTFTSEIVGLTADAASSAQLARVLATHNAQAGVMITSSGFARLFKVSTNSNVAAGLVLERTGPVAAQETNASWNNGAGVKIVACAAGVTLTTLTTVGNVGYGLRADALSRVSVSGTTSYGNGSGNVIGLPAKPQLNWYAFVAVVAVIAAVACEILRRVRGAGVISRAWVPEHVTNSR